MTRGPRRKSIAASGSPRFGGASQISISPRPPFDAHGDATTRAVVVQRRTPSGSVGSSRHVPIVFEPCEPVDDEVEEPFGLFLTHSGVQPRRRRLLRRSGSAACRRNRIDALLHEWEVCGAWRVGRPLAQVVESRVQTARTPRVGDSPGGDLTMRSAGHPSCQAHRDSREAADADRFPSSHAPRRRWVITVRPPAAPGRDGRV
jgi:hypothetical protein